MKSVTDYLTELEGMSVPDQADFWVISLDGEVDKVKDLAFRSWLSQDPDHQTAYEKSVEVWKLAGKAVNHYEAQPFRPHFSGSQPKQSKISIWVSSILMAVLLGALTIFGNFWSPNSTIYAETDFKEVNLPDGSIAYLEAASEITLNFDGSSRIIELEEGGIFVEVAHDKSRPFKVKLSNVEVQAIGTAYSVQDTLTGPLISVHEGIVQITENGENSIRLSAGNSWRNGSVITRPLTHLSYWKNGQLQVNNERLDILLTDFSRHIDGKLIWVDPEIAHIQVSGLFHLKNSEKLMDIFMSKYRIEKYSFLGTYALIKKNIQK